MGGLLNKLHQNRNDILVAYQTSGNIAVFDHEVRRYADFLRRFGSDFDINDSAAGAPSGGNEGILLSKKTGGMSPVSLQAVKAGVRGAGTGLGARAGYSRRGEER